jgi:uncharacterized protein (TIGR02284 family)
MENFGKQLNRLVKICLKTEHAYQKAAEHADSEELKNIFKQIELKRHEIILELQDQMAGHSLVDPEHSPDLIGSLNSTWESLSNIMSHKDDKHLIKMCRNSDHAALESYDEVLQGEILFSDLKPVLVKQRTSISEDSQRINYLYYERFPAASDDM